MTHSSLTVHNSPQDIQTYKPPKCWPRPELISFLHLRIQATSASNRGITWARPCPGKPWSTTWAPFFWYHIPSTSPAPFCYVRLSRHDTCIPKPCKGLLGCLCVNELWIRRMVVRIYDENVLPHVQSSERPQSALPMAGWCSLMDTNGHQRYVSLLVTRGNAWEREANHTAFVQL